MDKTAIQQLAGFIFIGRRHNHHIGDTAKGTYIIGAGVGGAIFTDQAGTIEGKQHIEILQGDIMNQLIITAL